MKQADEFVKSASFFDSPDTVPPQQIRRKSVEKMKSDRKIQLSGEISRDVFRTPHESRGIHPRTAF